MRPYRLLPLILLLLAGCDQVNGLLGLEDLVKKEERLDADGRAVGGGCRQSGRAIEDCYAIYSWLPRAAVFAGWRDMDAYMRENKIDTIVPQLPPVEPPGAKKRRPASDSAEGEEEKPTSRSKTKAKAGETKAGEAKAGDGEADEAVKKPESPADKPEAAADKKATTAKPKASN